MLYVVYIAVVVAVVFLSVKASGYIDLIDKKTSLSGAFLGGVLLSAVTSLPELFTSISATLLLSKPSLCMGNILGSNLFNLAILAMMFILFARSNKAKLAKGHSMVLAYCMMTYAAIALNMLLPTIFDFHILSLSLTSIIIVVLYAFGVKYLAADGGEGSEDSEDGSSLTIRGVVVRFVFCSIGLVALSILLTYLSDELALRLNMGAGLAGALFLGVATSLPELSSTVTLFRLRNYDIAVGNIVGSCLFNMIILAVADLLWFGGTIYDFADGNIGQMLSFGALAMVAMLVALRRGSRVVKLLCSLLILACYVAFLVI